MDTENFLARKKRLVDRLKTAALEKPEVLAKNTHKVRFLAQQEDILEARKAGWSFRQIWEELSKPSESEAMEPEFSGSYDLFVRYCRRYLPKQEMERPLANTPTPSVANTPVATNGFSYDGNPDPSKLY